MTDDLSRAADNRTNESRVCQIIRPLDTPIRSHCSEHLRVGDPEARSRYVRDALEQGWAANAARLGVAYMSRMSSSTVNNGLLPDAYLASQRPSR